MEAFKTSAQVALTEKLQNMLLCPAASHVTRTHSPNKPTFIALSSPSDFSYPDAGQISLGEQSFESLNV